MDPSSPLAFHGQRPLSPAAIASTYAGIGAAWIAFSDSLAALLANSPAHITVLQTYKGWVFVLLTAALLFLLLRRGRRNESRLRSRIEAQARQYRGLFETNPLPMWVYDRQTLAFLAVNDAAIDHYGYSRDEFLSMTIASLRPPEDVEALRRNLAIVTEGTGHAGVWHHMKRNGELIHVEITSSTLTFEGHPAELVLAHDVTAERATQQRVAEAEERLRLALEAAHQGLYDLDVQTGVAKINDEYAAMLGYGPGELVETSAAWIARLHPQDRDRVAHAYADYLAGRIPEYRVEFRQRTKQGNWKWILSLGRVMERDASGAPKRMLGTHTDIDAEKQAEARIRRLTNLYAALSQCNQAIARTDDRGELLQEVCRVAVDHGGLRMAWIGEIRDRQMVPVARFGARTDYVDGVRISLDAPEPLAGGPSATSVREDRHVICGDIESDPIMVPWRERALQCGFLSSAAFPLRCNGRAVGTLNLYAAEARFFDAELVGLVDEMALDISFAFDRFRLKSEQQSAERRFRALVDHASDAIFVSDMNGRIVDANAAASTALGYTREELLGYSIADLDPVAAAMGSSGVRRLLEEAMDKRQVILARHRRKDGSTFPVEVRAAGVRLPDGDFVIGMVRDISETQRAEQALRESEQRFRLISQAASDILYSCRHGPDGEFEIDWMLGAVERITGYTAEELIARRCWRCLVTAEDREIFHRNVVGLAAGSSASCELRLQRKDGGTVWIASVAECTPEDKDHASHRLYGALTDITQRKIAEVERERLLAEADTERSRFRELVERISDGFAALDRDWRYVFINDRGAAMLGRRPQDLLGRHVWSEFPDEVGGPFHRTAEFAMAQQKPQTVEDYVPAWDRWLESRIYPSTEGLAVLFQDVTERKCAGRRLAQSEERLRTLMDLLPHGVQENDLDGRITFANPALDRINRAAEGTLIGRVIWDMLAAEADRDALRAYIGLLARKQPEPEPYFARTRCDDGSEVDIQIDWTYRRDAEGRVTGFISVITDITERKRAELALRDSEARLRRVIDEMPVLLAAFDEQGNVIHWNKECERVTGYRAAEIVGNPAAMELLYPDADDRMRMIEAWRGREHAYRDWESSLTAREGRRRHIAWSNVSGAVPIPGWPVWGIGVDITARRSAEDALAEHAERLQALSHRLLAVQEEERRALARELHDEVGQQLTALKLNLNMLRAGTPGTETQRLNDSIDITNLTIELIRDTALNLRPSVLDDLGLVSALHWYARRQAQRSGCSIGVRAAVPPLPGDLETALFRIVQEAVNNALRHGVAKSIDVDLEMTENIVHLQVADDGAGFDATANVTASMGLLSMRERTELLGGRFVLDSSPGAGTRVRADIPLELPA